MIEIACIGEGAYLRHTGAMLHSALSHLSAPARIHVLQETAAEPEELSRLRATTGRFNAELVLHLVPAEALADFPSGYFPRAIWLRVLLPELLPGTARILYLDSDMVVTDDLLPLWESDLADALLGAVTNPFYPFMPPYPRMRLGIEEPQQYFNSGMLLMNLAAMREAATARRFHEFARRERGLLYPDQDALNIVCRNRWLALHPRWNVQSTLYDLRPRQLPFSPEIVAEARAHPAVIHFIGPFKPWHYLCRHPMRAVYFQHAAQTPWGAPTLEGRTLRNFLIRGLPLSWIDKILRGERWARRRLSRLRHRLGTS